MNQRKVEEMGTITIPIVYLIFIAIIAVIVFVLSGYSVFTKWGSISKESVMKTEVRLIEKLKSQTKYSGKMKFSFTMDVCNLYEECLSKYIVDNNIELSKDQIEDEKLYYDLISTKINDQCEDITIFSYIFDNNLHKYKNKDRWKNFKEDAIDEYNRKGKKVLDLYYNDKKLKMPKHEWLKRRGQQLGYLLDFHANRLLERLQEESFTYHEDK